MRTIYKYPFTFYDDIKLEIPEGAEIIHAAIQNNTYCLWALVDTDRPTELRRFKIVGTGHPLTDSITITHHMATILDGKFVWHIFETGALE